MAEEAKKKAEAPDKAAPAADKAGDKKEHGKAGAGGMLTKMPVLIGGVMIIEAAVLFAGIKFLGGGAPHAAEGADLTLTEEEEKAAAAEAEEKPEAAAPEAAAEAGGTTAPTLDKKALYEVEVLKSRFLNKQGGRTFLYDVTVFAVVKGANSKKVEERIQQRKNLISDRVRTIIAQSDPEKLGGGSEPGLETLRRQVKYQLDDIVGEGMIEEVLVPQCIPFRTDF